MLISEQAVLRIVLLFCLLAIILENASKQVERRLIVLARRRKPSFKSIVLFSYGINNRYFLMYALLECPNWTLEPCGIPRINAIKVTPVLQFFENFDGVVHFNNAIIHMNI